MRPPTWLPVLLGLVALCQAGPGYRAVVVEFYPLNGTFLQNLQTYEDLIATAARLEAQIIVFPEYGLTTTVVAPFRPLCINIGQEVPPLDSNPCDELPSNGSVNTEAVRRLSCAAKAGGLYVVANLIERQPCAGCASDDYLIYNTNVAFNANGTLVARYRKFNRYGEAAVNVTATPDLAVFSTPFGVFGTFTCMDLLFHAPAVRLVKELGVTDVAFPTAWFSELPFLTAVQAQSAWALGHGVNFLAAGYNNPQVGNTGSGIYAAGYGPVVTKMAQDAGTTFVIGDVPASNVTGGRSRSRRAVRQLQLKNDNLRDYTSAPLSAVIGSAQRVVHCQANLCCAADYELESVGEDFNYRLVVIDGIVTHDGGNYINREQVCSVIACGGANTTSCSDDLEFSAYSAQTKFKSLVVSGNFSTDLLQPNTLVVPSLITLRTPEDFDFTNGGPLEQSSIALATPRANIHAFGIFAHDFEPPGF